MAFYTSLLSLSPRIRRDGDSLVVTTGLVSMALTLGTWRRRLEIKPLERSLCLEDAICYFWHKRRTLRFDQVQAVTYGYVDEAAAANWLSWGHDTVDNFRVGLRLKDDQEIHFFAFYGAGAFQHDGVFPDWWFWDEYLFDAVGTQETTSRRFVDLLCRLFDVAVIPPRP